MDKEFPKGVSLRTKAAKGYPDKDQKWLDSCAVWGRPPTMNDLGHNMLGPYSLAASCGGGFSRVMPFPAVRVEEYVSVSQLLPKSVTSLSEQQSIWNSRSRKDTVVSS